MEIEQYPQYEVDEWFNIWVYIEAYTWMNREVYLYVETVYEDGTVDVLFDENVPVEGNKIVVKEFDLIYSKTGHYEVYAHMEYFDDFNLVTVYEDCCCFDIVDYLPDYTIWINQQFMYPVNEYFYIYLEVTSNVNFEQDVFVYCTLNGTEYYSGYVTVGARGHVSIELDFNLAVTGYYEITATISDGFGFTYFDDYCYFWVTDFSGGYAIYIDQKDWYRADKDFSIILHVASYTAVDAYINITLKINDMVYFEKTNFWMGNESYEMFWVNLYFSDLGGHDVYARVWTDPGILTEDWCYFDIIRPLWYDMWIEQDWGYVVNEWFTVWVWIQSYSDYDVDVDLTVEITYDDGHVETVWQETITAYAHSTDSMPIDLFFDHRGHYKIHAFLEYYWGEDYHYYDTWCEFDIVDYIPDYFIRIEQDFVYVANKAFSIYIVVESNLDVSTMVTLAVQLNGTFKYYENITVNAFDVVDVQISLNYTIIGFYEVHAWLEDPYEHYDIVDAWCGFHVRAYENYYLYVGQRLEYEAYSEFFITIWIYSNLGTSQKVNLTVFVGGVNVYYEESLWVDAHSVIGIDVWLYMEVLGGYEVEAYIEIDGAVVAEGYCYFEIIEERWVDVYIYQEPFYYIYDEFTISVGVIASYPAVVNITLFINDDWISNWDFVELTPHVESIFDWNLGYDYPGFFNVRAEVTEFEEETGNILWWDAYCSFDIYEPEAYNLEIWQDWFYFDTDEVEITVAVYSNLDYHDSPYLEVHVVNVATNSSYDFDEHIDIDPYGSYFYDVYLSTLETGHYKVYAAIHTGDKVYEQFCNFEVVEWSPVFVFIEQEDWYTVDEEFSITVWVYNNLDYDIWVNLKVLITHPDGSVETVFLDAVFVYAGESLPVTVYLYYGVVGPYDIEAIANVGGEVYYGYCYFYVDVYRWIDIWIIQDEYYPAYQNFTISISLTATYETEVRIKVNAGGRFFEFQWHLEANVELVFDIYLFFNFEGWIDVHAYVEDLNYPDIWNESDCGFYVGFPSDYEMWIEQDFAYMLDSTFEVYVVVKSKIDITQTGHLRVEVDELGMVYDADVTVDAYSSTSVTIVFEAGDFTAEGFYGIRAFFVVNDVEYGAYCGFEMQEYDEFWVLIIQEDQYEVDKSFEIGIIIISNIGRGTNANLTLQIGSLNEDDTIYLYPYDQMEIWIPLLYRTTGFVDVHVELEVSPEVYTADCGFDIVEDTGSFHNLRLKIDAESDYDIDESFIVKFRVENTGQTKEPVNITIQVDGAVVISVLKDLKIGDVWEYQMSFQYSSAGVHTYDIIVDSTVEPTLDWSLSKTVSIGGATETTETTESTTTESSGQPEFSPGFDLVTALIALLSLITAPVAIRRKRK